MNVDKAAKSWINFEDSHQIYIFTFFFYINEVRWTIYFLKFWLIIPVEASLEPHHSYFSGRDKNQNMDKDITRRKLTSNCVKIFTRDASVVILSGYLQTKVRMSPRDVANVFDNNCDKWVRTPVSLLRSHSN